MRTYLLAEHTRFRLLQPNPSISCKMAAIDLACAPIAFLLVLMPHFIKSYLSRGKVDMSTFNINPRGNTQALLGKLGDDGAQIQRAVSAHQNGWESLILFYGSLAMARFGRVDANDAGVACIVYVVSRFLYNIAYIYGHTRGQAAMRSTLWFVGIAACMYLQINGVISSAK